MVKSRKMSNVIWGFGGDSNIIRFYSSISEYPFSDAIPSPRRALILTAGWEILSFGARSAN